MPLLDRILPRLDASGDCWLWTGALKPNGYGQVMDYSGEKPRCLYVHREVYKALVGSIPADKVLDHLCRVRHCANPDHLQVVDERTNIRRGYAPGVVISRTGRCGKGHETVARSDGRRRCPTCTREYDRARRAADPEGTRRQFAAWRNGWNSRHAERVATK